MKVDSQANGTFPFIRLFAVIFLEAVVLRDIFKSIFREENLTDPIMLKVV